MADRETEKQSSVLFSLRELMKLEEQRIDEEKQREDETRLANQRAKMEAELRLRAAEEARRRAEAERRAAEDAARREQEARLEAIRLAAVERARLEAQEKARLDELALAQRHQQEVARLHNDADKRRLSRTVIGVSVAGVVLLGSGAGGYLGVVRPKALAEQAALEQRVAQETAAREAAEREARARDERIRALESERDRARDERTKLELQQRIDALKEPTSPGKRAPGRLPVPGRVESPSSGPCNSKDPLDPCLK